MIPVPRREHRLLIAIHGWAGVSLGLLLLVIVATGTVAVFGQEIGSWSSGSLVARSPLTRPLDADFRRLLATVPPDLHHRVDLSATAANHLAVTARGAPGADERGIVFDVAPGGLPVGRLEGFTRDIETADPSGALSNFLIHVHVRLYVPEPWGYAVTGLAGLAMLVAALSGIVIHRHLLTDLFTLRRNGSPVLRRRDAHGVVGAWALPFVFLLAFTGCFFSFASSFGLPIMAWASFGGDQQKLIATLVGTPETPNPASADGADLDGIVADATTRAGTPPEFVMIDRPGRADARVTLYHAVKDGELTRTTLVYDGGDGRFLGEKPGIGRVASLGGTLFGLMAPLHFGDFAGLLSKVVWAALGYATCVVTVSGIRLWLVRRDLGRLEWSLLDRLTSLAAFGLPFAMGTAAAAFFAARPAGATVWWTAAGFVAGLGWAAVVTALAPRAALDGLLRAGTGLVLIAIPALRFAMGGPGWLAALGHGQTAVAAGDVALVLIGAAFFAGTGPSLSWAGRTFFRAAE